MKCVIILKELLRFDEGTKYKFLQHPQPPQYIEGDHNFVKE
jgi:hypothetical protein